MAEKISNEQISKTIKRFVIHQTLKKAYNLIGEAIKIMEEANDTQMAKSLDEVKDLMTRLDMQEIPVADKETTIKMVPASRVEIRVKDDVDEEEFDMDALFGLASSIIREYNADIEAMKKDNRVKELLEYVDITIKEEMTPMYVPSDSEIRMAIERVLMGILNDIDNMPISK